MDDQQDSAMVLNGLAQGTIGPKPRIDAGEISKQEVQAFIEALHDGTLFTHVSAMTPRKCVDGRFRADRQNTFGPDAAGGTVTLVVADALTSSAYRTAGERASVHTANVLRALIDRNEVVGGHDADVVHGAGSGCGACDKLDVALKYIADRSEDLRTTMAGLGVTVDDAAAEMVRANAQKLVDEQYADGGPTIIRTVREVAGADAVETLTGDHKEVAVVINTKPQTTLNRGLVREQFGDKFQAFNVDIWALEQSAKNLAQDDTKAQQFYYAALCYNVAVAAVLSDASLRIVVR